MKYPNNHRHKFFQKDHEKMMCSECEFELDGEYYIGYVLPLEAQLSAVSAEEWDKLQSRIKVLEEALKPFSELKSDSHTADSANKTWLFPKVFLKDILKARQALSKSRQEDNRANEILEY